MDIEQYINVSISEKSKKILKIVTNPYLYAILRYTDA